MNAFIVSKTLTTKSSSVIRSGYSAFSIRRHEMKRVLLLVICSILLLSALTGCISNNRVWTKYADIDELMAAVGDGVSFPLIPAGYSMDQLICQGWYYKQTDSWEYQIRLDDSGFPLYRESPEHIMQIEPGSPALTMMEVRAYEPEHKINRLDNPNRDIERQMHDRYIEEYGGDMVFFTTSAKLGEKTYDDGAIRPACWYLVANSSFVENEVLYTLEIRVYGNDADNEDDLREWCKRMVESIVEDMRVSAGY